MACILLYYFLFWQITGNVAVLSYTITDNLNPETNYEVQVCQDVDSCACIVTFTTSPPMGRLLYLFMSAFRTKSIR